MFAELTESAYNKDSIHISTASAHCLPAPVQCPIYLPWHMAGQSCIYTLSACVQCKVPNLPAVAHGWTVLHLHTVCLHPVQSAQSTCSGTWLDSPASTHCLPASSAKCPICLQWHMAGQSSICTLSAHTSASSAKCPIYLPWHMAGQSCICTLSACVQCKVPNLPAVAHGWTVLHLHIVCLRPVQSAQSTCRGTWLDSPTTNRKCQFSGIYP